MGVVGVALIVALMLKFKVARVLVVIVCVLSRLVLGATPIGEPVNDALADLGGSTTRSRICDGAVPAPCRPAGPHPRPAGPVSAWAVLGALACPSTLATDHAHSPVAGGLGHDHRDHDVGP